MTCHSGTFGPRAGGASKVSLDLGADHGLAGHGRRLQAGDPRRQRFRPTAAQQQRSSGRLGSWVVFAAQVREDRTWE
jgi:hypothetical protein